MKRVLAALAALFLSLPALATEFKAAEAFTLPAGRIQTNELWMQARTITFAGEALDDCFLLADHMNQGVTTNPPTLQLPGRFKTDLWAAGETVELTGSVASHARLAAIKTLLVAGPVGGNLMALAPTITIATNSLVHGTTLLAGQDVIINGELTGDTRVFGTTVTLAGNFGGNLSITATEINVMPGTRIAGNLSYHMDHDLVLDSRVTLGGRMIKTDLVQPEPSGNTTASLMLQLGLLCGAILTGMLFVSLMPGIVALSVHKLADSPWRCILYGFVTLALVPMTIFFLVFTLVGIPLCIVLAMGYLILVYIAKIVVGLYAGHLLIRRKAPMPPNLLFPVMSLGLLLLYVATSLPFPIGITFWFAITLAGMGALVGAMMDRRIPVMVSYPADTQGKPPPLPGEPPAGSA